MTYRFPKRARQSDIARKVGVTQATVSLVLGAKDGRSRISPRIAAKIRKIALELNYRPDSAARRLLGMRTGVVGVIVRHISDYFHSLPTQAVQLELSSRGFTAFLGHANSKVERVEQYLDEFARHGADGILCLEPVVWDRPALLERLLGMFPCAVFYTSHRRGDLCVVDVDRAAAVRLAVRRLVQHGYQRIALATWNDKEPGFRPSVQARWRGYREELEALKVPFDKRLIFDCQDESLFGPPSEKTIDDVISRLVVEQKARAIIGYDDYWAMRLIRQLQCRSLRVPQDVAVMGIGNEPRGEIFNPAITTVDMRHEAIAAPMVTMLEGLLKDGQVPPAQRVVMVEPCLVIRESA